MSISHLPALTIEQCLSVFQAAGITFNMLSTGVDRPGLLPYSRQSLYLWRRGRNPHSTAMNAVSTLAYRALACLRARTLPMGKRPKLDAVKAVLDAVDLATLTPEILPAKWREEVATN